MVQNTMPNIIHHWICGKCGFSLAVKQDDNKTIVRPPIPFEPVTLSGGRAEKKWCPICVKSCFGPEFVHERDVEVQKKYLEKDQGKNNISFSPVNPPTKVIQGNLDRVKGAGDHG